MGTINSKVKDAAIAGDFSARLQWLRDEITEYDASIQDLLQTLESHAWASEDVARAHIDATMEAYDIFGLLIKFESRRLLEYFCFTIKTRVVDCTMSMGEHDYLLGVLDDHKLGQSGYVSWHAKQVEKGRQPITIASFQRLREVLKNEFGMRRVVNLDDIPKVFHIKSIKDLVDIIESLGREGGTNE